MFLTRTITKAILRDFNIVNKGLSRTMSNAPSLLDIKVNDATGIATVTMQRAPVNSLNLDLLQALSTTLDEIASNRSRGMILTSAMPTTFSAGLDIMEFVSGDQNRQKEFWASLQDCWLKLFGSTFPTAAAISGHAPAGGCLLAMCCEYRVMIEGKFAIGLNETALGISAPKFFQNTLRNTIPNREAELALTLGKLYSVDDALKIGLIDEIAKDKNDALAKCEMFLGKFAKISPMARSMSKMIFRQGYIKELEDTRDEDLQQFMMAINLPKVQKSLHAYIQALKNKGS